MSLLGGMVLTARSRGATSAYCKGSNGRTSLLAALNRRPSQLVRCQDLPGSLWYNCHSVDKLVVHTRCPTRMYSTKIEASTNTEASDPPKGEIKEIYQGPLSKVARIIKRVSIASFVGTTCAVPFFIWAESRIPMAARTVLAVTSMATTSASTAIITWALKPYITRIRVAEDAADRVMLVDTMSFTGRQLTRAVRVDQLEPSERFLTTWKVAKGDQGAAEMEIGGERARVAKPGTMFYTQMEGDGVKYSEVMREIQEMVNTGKKRDD